MKKEERNEDAIMLSVLMSAEVDTQLILDLLSKVMTQAKDSATIVKQHLHLAISLGEKFQMN